jgi:hypothetical protein
MYLSLNSYTGLKKLADEYNESSKSTKILTTVKNNFAKGMDMAVIDLASPNAVSSPGSSLTGSSLTPRGRGSSDKKRKRQKLRNTTNKSHQHQEQDEYMTRMQSMFVVEEEKEGQQHQDLLSALSDSTIQQNAAIREGNANMVGALNGLQDMMGRFLNAKFP